VADAAHARSHFGPAHYLAVWGALVLLTAATVGVAKVEMPHWAHVTVALVIATGKAGLVALFFMHLWEHGGAIRLVLVVSVLFLVLLIGLVLADNATRFQYANPPYSESWGEAPFEAVAPPMQDAPAKLEKEAEPR